MSLVTKRIELAKWILETEEEVLDKIEAIKKEFSNVVCVTVDGIPLTKEKYRQRLLDAEVRIEKGEFTKHEDLLEEMKNW